MRVLSINGPNLNLLGTREPEVYGTTTLGELEDRISAWGERLGVDVDHLQSNDEGALIDAIHASTHDGIVINPGALTHTSRALGDAVGSVDVPVVEVHISNIHEREPWRGVSVLSDVAALSIYGRGQVGYRDALRHLVNRAEMGFETITYGPHPDNLGDLRRGGDGLVILVHGGFWRHEWTRDTMESLAVDLSRRGHNTWNIEYRRLGRGGGWPGSAHDVLMALEFAPRLGADAEKPIVIGHSAGGHLGLWAASQAPVDRIVALAPVIDLAKHAMAGMFGSAEAKQLLDHGAPHRLSAPDAPTLLVHGTDDDLVPHEQSSGFADEHNRELLSVSGGHFELLDPAHEHWERVLAVLGTD